MTCRDWLAYLKFQLLKFDQSVIFWHMVLPPISSTILLTLDGRVHKISAIRSNRPHRSAPPATYGYTS